MPDRELSPAEREALGIACTQILREGTLQPREIADRIWRAAIAYAEQQPKPDYALIAERAERKGIELGRREADRKAEQRHVGKPAPGLDESAAREAACELARAAEHRAETAEQEKAKLRETLAEISETYTLNEGSSADANHLRDLARAAVADRSGDQPRAGRTTP
jgi:hypothetical protein